MAKKIPPTEDNNSTVNGAGSEHEPAGRTVADAHPCLVVGIGASAGGQEALEQIFTATPPDCGLSFVVIMHIPPAGPSFLAEMLGRYTSMPVVTAEEGMVLLPNRVQVIPAGWEIIVARGAIALKEPELRGVHHPIDRLLHSLAEEAGESAIAVILSGSGSDGARGLKAIRSAGGTVIVQEPGSAMFPDMPLSAIATKTVDFILPAEEIADKIAELAGKLCPIHPPACRVINIDENLAAIFDIVKARTGHDFSSYKTNTVMRRIERRMAVNEISGIRKYVDLLEETPQEAQALAQDILIGVTGFFRDPEAFANMEQVVIPRLFADRNPDEPVRIWHACCATGEEVYSMAFLIREYLDRHGSNAKIQIFATDLDEISIAQARAGIYPEGIEAELGEQRLKTYFTRSGKRWQVVKQVREMIVFAHHSMIKNPPFSRLDLLVCRNFLIYLNSDMQKRLIALFHQALRPGRFLFLGSSETVGRNVDLFSTLDKKWKIFIRTEVKSPANALFPFTTPVRYLPGTARSPGMAAAVEMSHVAVAERLLMERYAPPCVIVTEKYAVVHVTSRLNSFLQVPVGEPSRDILRMAREELRPALRAAIHKAFAENRRVDFRGLKVVADGAETTVNLLVEPLEAGHAAGKLAMVVFEPASQAPAALPVGSEEALRGDETTGETLVRQLEEQLRITHEQLQATTEQLESSNEGFLSANEELISMNEEFQSANEELQSTNEELETSKEELQALNEELATVNAELQEKVEELNEVNSDMENLLTSSEIATIFLDRQLTIKRFSPAMAVIFNLIPADIGRLFRHLAGTIDWSDLPSDAAAVLEKLSPVEREVSTVEDGRCFLMRVLPYRGAGGLIDGIVVTLTDISQHKRMEEQTVHLASFPQLNPNPVLEVDAGGRIIFANPATQKILESLGMAAEAAALFLPADLDSIMQEWDRNCDVTFYREIVISDRTFGESIFLTPRFEVARIYAFEITERKRAQEALAESEARVRRKLESIISPEGDIGNLDLGDIIDAPAVQSLMDDFHKLVVMPMAIIDLKGKVLVGKGWQEICTEFHRVNTETCANCIESDVKLSEGVPRGEYRLYKCKNNMWDVATPIMIGDKHFGNLFMGQFFFDNEPLDYAFFRKQARKYDFDEKKYIAALEAVPRLNRETLNTSMSFFMKLADLLSKQSYSNLKLARSLAERENLMESLAESELFYRQTLESIPGMVFTTRPDGYCDYQSQQWVDFTGVPMSEHVGDGWNKLLHPDDRPRAYAAWQAAVEERAPYDLEYRVRGHDGKYEWFKVRGRPIRNEAGEIVRWFGTAVNIDQLLKTQEVLRLQEERLRLAMSAAQMASWDWHLPSGDLVWNDTHYRMMGYEPGEVQATYQAWASRVHPDDLETIQTLIQQCMTEGLSYTAEFRTLWPDGTIRWLEARGEFEHDTDNQPLRCYGIMLDITDRKQAEELIQHHVEELQAINADLERFNNASVGRELRMIELKKEINTLCVQTGLKPRYSLDFEKEDA